MSLDERLESVRKGMQAISDSLGPLFQSAPTPTLSQNGDMSENALMLRKHATLSAEWVAVQDESEVLREELKEDKWLTVFRTVTDQADGMMSSLEKAVNRCQVCCFGDLVKMARFSCGWRTGFYLAGTSARSRRLNAVSIVFICFEPS